MPACNPRRYVSTLIIFGIFTFQVSSQEPTISDVYKLPGRPADYRISYGTDSLQFADLRLPSGTGPHPVAIIIHGGCWLASVATLKYTAPLSDALCNEGIATWNIEYNHVGHPKGGWPGTFRDIAHATDYLRVIAEEHNLDLKRVITIGHSAGAHLALWAAARHKLDPESEIYTENPLPLKGVVALSAPVDLENLIGLAFEVCGDSVITKLCGGLPNDVMDNYNNSSPIRLLPLGIPQRFIVGERDIPVLLEDINRYVGLAQQANDDIRLEIIECAWHNEISVPGSISWLKVREAILSLLDTGKE